MLEYKKKLPAPYKLKARHGKILDKLRKSTPEIVNSCVIHKIPASSSKDLNRFKKKGVVFWPALNKFLPNPNNLVRDKNISVPDNLATAKFRTNSVKAIRRYQTLTRPTRIRPIIHKI